MTDNQTFSQRFQAFKARYFPERQLFLRSEGRVSFVKLGSGLQMSVLATLLLFFIWVGVSSINYLTRDMAMEAKINQIADLRSDYQKLDDDYSSLDSEVKARVDTIEERQTYLESQLDGNIVEKPAPLPEQPSSPKPSKDKSQAMLLERMLGGGTAYASVDFSRASERESTIADLRKLDGKQRELAGRLLARSQTKLAAIDNVLKNTSVNIARLIDLYSGETSGMGGPYVPEKGFSPLFAQSDNELYQTIQNDAMRLDIATSALDSFPTGEPAAKYYVSSRYGRRKDPFTKRNSSHYGLDMAGWPGTAIQATANGKVIKAGISGPYGRMVEIDHGNGFHTRYGHMNKLHVKVGQQVKHGHRIGDMGKTGRATSSHLHYEIWFEGKVQDPLPFIKAAEDVRKIQGRYESS